MTDRSWDYWDSESKEWLSWDKWNKAEWNSRINTMAANHFFDGFITLEKAKAARNDLKLMYFQSGVKTVMEKDDECLRSQLYNHVGVKSNTRCQMCSVCIISDVMSNQITVARQRDAIRNADNKMVDEVLSALKEKCFACSKQSCDGLDCILKPTFSKNNGRGIHRQHWCRLCFGGTWNQDGFHTTFNKQGSTNPLCHVARFTENGKACQNCCMFIEQNVTNRGKKTNTTRVGNCMYKLRIRRILLHGVKGRTDKGLHAYTLIKDLVNNKVLWYKTMAKHIKPIKNERSAV